MTGRNVGPPHRTYPRISLGCALRYGANPYILELDQAERDSAALFAETYPRCDTLLDRMTSDNSIKHMVVRSHFCPIESGLPPKRVNRVLRDETLPKGT